MQSSDLSRFTVCFPQASFRLQQYNIIFGKIPIHDRDIKLFMNEDIKYSTGTIFP